MSNHPEHIVDLINRLPTNSAREALENLKFPFIKDQIELASFIGQFIESVALIQEKSSRQVPALLKASNVEVCRKDPS